MRRLKIHFEYVPVAVAEEIARAEEKQTSNPSFMPPTKTEPYATPYMTAEVKYSGSAKAASDYRKPRVRVPVTKML